MSILVDWEIKQAMEWGEIYIFPFDEKLINPQSMDIRLGDSFTETYLGHGHEIVNPLNKESFINKTTAKNNWVLGGGQSILVSMFEHVKLAPNICAQIKGKSSCGRLHIINSSHAGHVDGGWDGVLTMEIFNAEKYSILLSKEMKIGQLVFTRTSRPSKSYAQTGRYNNQLPGSGSKGI